MYSMLFVLFWDLCHKSDNSVHEYWVSVIRDLATNLVATILIWK